MCPESPPAISLAPLCVKQQLVTDLNISSLSSDWICELSTTSNSNKARSILPAASRPPLGEKASDLTPQPRSLKRRISPGLLVSPGMALGAVVGMLVGAVPAVDLGTSALAGGALVAREASFGVTLA